MPEGKLYEDLITLVYVDEDRSGIQAKGRLS